MAAATLLNHSHWRAAVEFLNLFLMRHQDFALTVLTAFVAAMLFCGCSAFNYEWRQAAKKPTPANDITGRWEGNWLSHANGHNDKLRCLMTRVDTNHYDAKFHAAYGHPRFKWLTVYYGYTVRLETEPGTNGVTFRGQEDLGALAGGIYTYAGSVNGTNFFSTYKCKYDHGVFQMRRPMEK